MPCLILGTNLREFIRTLKESRKRHLRDGEFYCVRCRAGKKTLPSELRLHFTGKMFGNGAKQVIAKGICSECGAVMTLFTSEHHISKFTAELATSTEYAPALCGSKCHSVDDDIERYSKNGSQSQE
jgi:hypothetical protein